jgi:hypothetical protein
MRNRSRLHSVLLVTGTLAGFAACGQSEPTTAFPRSSASSGGYSTTIASTNAPLNDPMNTGYRPSRGNLAPTATVAPGNGAAGFDRGLNGNRIGEGGQGMGGYGTAADPINQGSTGSTASGVQPAVPSTPGSLDSTPPITTNAGISGNVTTRRESGTATTSTGPSRRPRTGSASPNTGRTVR